MFAEFTSAPDRAGRGRLAVSAGASLALYGALAAAAALAGTAAAPAIERRVKVVFRPPPAPIEVAPAAPPPRPIVRPPPPRTLKTIEVADLPPPAALVEPAEVPLEKPAEAEPTGDAIPVPPAPAAGASYGGAHGSRPGGEAIHLPEHATPPVALASNPQPEYPEAARARSAEGQVVLKIVVDAAGAVTRVEVLRGDEPFVSAAVAAVRRWRYAPALLEGTPVAAYRIVKVPFRLRDG